MSKTCLKNIIISRSKIKDKEENVVQRVTTNKEELINVSSDISVHTNNFQKVQRNLNEQRNLGTTLNEILNKVRVHAKRAEQAQDKLSNSKGGDVGVILLKELRAKLQTMKNVKKVDVCNQLYLNLTKIYAQRKEALSKETCLTRSLSKTSKSRPASTKARTFGRKCSIFSFLKDDVNVV